MENNTQPIMSSEVIQEPEAPKLKLKRMEKKKLRVINKLIAGEIKDRKSVV